MDGLLGPNSIMVVYMDSGYIVSERPSADDHQGILEGIPKTEPFGIQGLGFRI